MCNIDPAFKSFLVVNPLKFSLFLFVPGKETMSLSRTRAKTKSGSKVAKAVDVPIPDQDLINTDIDRVEDSALPDDSTADPPQQENPHRTSLLYQHSLATRNMMEINEAIYTVASSAMTNCHLRPPFHLHLPATKDELSQLNVHHSLR